MYFVTYNEYILSNTSFIEANPGLIFMQDNARYPFSYQSILARDKENGT
jgi:hypothetical protein